MRKATANSLDCALLRLRLSRTPLGMTNFEGLLVAPGATVAAAAATARATIATLHFGAGLVDAESAAAELAAVQGSNGAVSFAGV